LKQPIDIPRRVSDILSSKGLNVSTEGLVTFQDDSRSHPRNWPLLRKCYDSALICFLEFFMTLVSNTGSSVSAAASAELGLGRETGIFVFVTVYLLGQALGGLVFPPIAESFGGRMIYLSTTFFFGVFCLVITLSPTVPAVVMGRAFSGFVSAMPAVVACGSLENMWDTKARIYLIHLWICGAVLGLAFGPPMATYVSASDFGW
jgi:MFS family permease